MAAFKGPAGDRVFLFGGYTTDATTAEPQERALGDLWELDQCSPGAAGHSPAAWQWRHVKPSSGAAPLSWPQPRANSSLVSVPGSGHVFLFGGYSGWAEPRTMFGDLWSFHVASGKWAMLDCERFGAGEQHRACPSPRSGHGAVAAAPRSPGTVGDMWVFGGWNGRARMHNDLHRLAVLARPRLKRLASGPVSEQWPAPEAQTPAGTVEAVWSQPPCTGRPPSGRACFGFAALEHPKKVRSSVRSVCHFLRAFLGYTDSSRLLFGP